MNLDWIDDFNNKFGHYEEIQNLNNKQFHGKLEINFMAGKVQNYNLTTHRRAVNIDNQATLKEGGQQ